MTDEPKPPAPIKARAYRLSDEDRGRLVSIQKAERLASVTDAMRLAIRRTEAGLKPAAKRRGK